MSGSTVLLVFEFVAMAIFVAYLHRYYRSPFVGKDVNISTYVAWVFGFSGIILLPFGNSFMQQSLYFTHLIYLCPSIDVAVAFVDNERMKSLRTLWDFIYWRYLFCIIVFQGFNFMQLFFMQYFHACMVCFAYTINLPYVGRIFDERKGSPLYCFFLCLLIMFADYDFFFVVYRFSEAKRNILWYFFHYFCGVRYLHVINKWRLHH